MPRLHELWRHQQGLAWRLGAFGERKPSLHPRGGGGGYQLLRYGEHVFARRIGRGDRAPAARICAARRDRGRDQGFPAVAAGPQCGRSVAQGADAGGGRQPDAAGDGLCRSLPDPPLGRCHADRGNDGGAARHREGGQGALYRRLVDVRLAVRQGAGGGPREWLDAVHLDAEPRQSALPRGRARNAAALRRSGRGGHSLEPAGARQARPRMG